MMDQIQNHFCLILRDELSQSDREDIESMSITQWREIYAISCSNHLLAALFRQLKRHRIAIPAELETILRHEYLSRSGNDLRRQAQLRELIGIFLKHHIDHILLKGSHLAEKVYANPVLRPMCDIDVLIGKSEVIQVSRLLQTAGYTSSKPGCGDVELTDGRHLLPLIKPGGLAVELHWNINAEFPDRGLAGLWNRARTVTIGGLNTKVLSPEDLLLHLSVHKGCDDKFVSSLLALNDVKAIGATAIDWDLLYELAVSGEEWGNTKCLFAMLHLAKKLLAADVPDHFLNRIKPADFDQMHENRLIGQLFTRINADVSTYGAVRALYQLSRRFNWRLLGNYFMSPRKICLRYDRQYSWRVLPVLYCSRIVEKSRRAWRVITGISKNEEMKELYRISRLSSEVEEWLKSKKNETQMKESQ